MGESRHIANESSWKVNAVSPDCCIVGNSVVSFNSFALINSKTLASPNVKAQGVPVYRIGDMCKAVQADAGQHVVAGTSLGGGHVKFLPRAGMGLVRVNGIPVIRHNDYCMINCNGGGVGGALAQVKTEPKFVGGGGSSSGHGASGSWEEKSALEQAREESGKVLSDKWKGLKDSAKTVWEAIPFTSDEATTSAARSKIGNGILGAAEGLGTLMGPPPEMVQSAYMSGNADSIALVEQMQQRQSEAGAALIDHIGQSIKDSYNRNGVAGAGAMVLTTLGVEVLGGKGSGALVKVGERIAEIVHTAKNAADAARLLDKEVDAARLAGKSKTEIELLEKARDERRAQAAREAGDDVHVKARNMPEHKVPCFHPYDKPGFQKLSPLEQRKYLDDYAKQLRGQTEALSKMTAGEFVAARDAYAAVGRNPAAAASQTAFGNSFKKELQDSIFDSLKGKLGAAGAKAESAKQAQAISSKLAALHEPDMVMGGWSHPNPTRMGDSSVNSSIGASWNQEGRLAGAEAAARSADPNAKMKVNLRVCRGPGLRD